MKRSIPFLIIALIAALALEQRFLTAQQSAVTPPEQGDASQKNSSQKLTGKKQSNHQPAQWESLQEALKKLRQGNEEAPMQLLEPVQETPVESPLKIELVNAASGNLACVSSTYQESASSALVLWHIGTQIKNDFNKQTEDLRKQLSCLNYPVKKADAYSDHILYDTQFSPNGRYVLFKFGTPWASASSYQIYVFDTQIHLLKLIPLSPTYRRVSWSPDSNYIALVMGGDSYGNPEVQLGPQNIYSPLSLHICDWRNGKTYLVTENDTLRGPFSWIAPHTLLFGGLPIEDQIALRQGWQKQMQSQSQAEPQPEKLGQQSVSTDKLNAAKSKSANPPDKISLLQPNIYQFAIDDRQPRSVVHNGYRPIGSPDGQWIAFFGSEDPEKPYPLRPGWEDAPTGASLCVAHPDGTGRKALTRTSGFYLPVYWEHDSLHLLTIGELQSSPNVRLQIKEWDLQTGRWRQVTVLKAKDYKLMNNPGVESHLQVIGLSQDGLSLYVFVTEFVGRNISGNGSTGVAHLQIINLATGAIKTLIDLKGESGADWHESTAPVTSTIVSKVP